MSKKNCTIFYSDRFCNFSNKQKWSIFLAHFTLDTARWGKTSTRVVHRCVNADQENINLQKTILDLI